MYKISIFNIMNRLYENNEYYHNTPTCKYKMDIGPNDNQPTTVRLIKTNGFNQNQKVWYNMISFVIVAVCRSLFFGKLKIACKIVGAYEK